MNEARAPGTIFYFHNPAPRSPPLHSVPAVTMALTLKNTVAQRAATRPAARVAVPARRPMRVMASAQSDKVCHWKSSP